MYIYIGTDNNKLVAAELNDKNGDLVKIIQTVDPLIDPLPDGVKEKDFRVTEWVLKHPTFDLLYAFTSYFVKSKASITTFRIDPSSGNLEKIGCTFSGGYQAAHACFSPDGSTIVVSHHNDGTLCFFDCSQDKELGLPLKVVEIPAIGGDGNNTRTGPASLSMPSLHHALYSPNGNFVLTCDCSIQGCIWTVPVDSKGIPTLEEEPICNVLPIVTNRSSPNTLVSTLKMVFGMKYRIRRVAIHPSGKYAYVLYEFDNLIQVYEIDEAGNFGKECLQVIETLDDIFYDYWMFKGMGMNGAAELVATEEGLWVSNRGLKMGFGKVELSVRFFRFEEGGKVLARETMIEPAGSVRHFLLLDGDNDKIMTGVNKEHPGSIETWQKTDAGYKKLGEAAIGVDIQCMAKCATRVNHHDEHQQAANQHAAGLPNP